MKQETHDKILALGRSRKALLDELPKRPRGLSWCAEHTRIADEISCLLYEDVTAEIGYEPPIALIATGGFGRSELSPYSDIDMTIVPADEAAADLDGVIRKLFQDLHWAYCTVLRLDVGYAYRLISDAPGLDAKTRTGLMDMRLLAGSRELFQALDEALTAAFPAGEFILAKIEERRDMYRKFNDTPLVAEPQLKEGAGGLRDFHCTNWIGEAIGERAARPTSAYDLVVKYRNLLHAVSGKAQDQLWRPRQPEIAELLKSSPTVIVSELAGAGLELHQGYSRATAKLHEQRFALSAAAIAVGGEVRLLPAGGISEAAVGVAIATKLRLKVGDLPMWAGDSEGGPSAAFALSTGEATIRNLDRCHLLELLLPELTDCRTLVPLDGMHTYTVMEHSLRLVRRLDSLRPPGTSQEPPEEGEPEQNRPPQFLRELKAAVTDLEPLYLAALLHDVGKIDPDRDHSEKGTEMTRSVCDRWHLADSLSETAVWLVREHLTMVRFIRIRDIDHPATVDEFATIVGDSERLKLLTLLTWADVKSVSESAWTQALETFLRQLYERTALRLQGEMLPAPGASQSRQRLLRQLKKRPEDEKGLQQFLDSLPVYYLTGTTANQIRVHREMAYRATDGRPTVEEFVRNDLGATEITVCSLDTPGLLSRLLGVLYAHDLSVIGISACTTSTPPPVALDVFTVSFRGRPVPPATMGQVSLGLLNVISGEKTVDQILTAKGKDPSRRQEVFRYTFLPGSPGILEIHAPRGRGMAFRFSRLLSEHGWNIVSARVGQWAGKGAAAFYITDSRGGGLTPEQVRDVMAEHVARTATPGSP